MSHKQIALSDGHNNPRSKRDWCSTSPDLSALSTRDEVPVPTNDINFCTGQNRKSRLEGGIGKLQIEKRERRHDEGSQFLEMPL